jgi:hypothetical protein
MWFGRWKMEFSPFSVVSFWVNFLCIGDAMHRDDGAEHCDDVADRCNDGARHCSGEVVQFNHDAVRCPVEIRLTSCDAVH